MILCQQCKKNIATVHLTEIQSGQRNEKHLCEECARNMNLPHKHPISINDLIGALMEKSQKKGSPGKGKGCPECGMTFSEFKNKGRLGCANDYAFFQEEFEELLKKVHGSDRYVGKVPKGYGTESIYENELVKLKSRLKKVIQSEEYEEAARIRDRINELEKRIVSRDERTGEVED
jgi:protein arginine kinase activator